MDDLDQDLRQSLNSFKDKAGRNWKNQLRTAWMTGNYPTFASQDRANLQRIRNLKGSAWLQKY